MRKVLFATWVGAMAAFAAGPAAANDELNKMAQNPKDWVMPAGDYANTRYSKLNQITAANVGKLQVAWTFSTGVLRGHEGGPLIIGNMMYVHTPFPNKVYALDLSKDNQIVWKYEPKQDPNAHSGDVLRYGQPRRGLWRRQDLPASGRHHAGRARCQDRTGRLDGEERRPEQGIDRNVRAARGQGQGADRISGGEFGVQCHVTAYDMKTGKQAWRAFSEGPDDQIMLDPEKTMALGKPVGKDSSLVTWQGDQWKIGGGCTWGCMSYDPRAQPGLLRLGNPSTWKSEAASRRQQMVDDHLRARCRHRNGQVGLPDDAP